MSQITQSHNKSLKSKKWRPAAATKKRDQIMALSMHPVVKSNKQIAEVVGVARETVSRVLSENKATIDELKQRLEEYDSIMVSGLSISARAALYVQIATENVVKYPMAALKALERMDDIHGIVTERDKIRVKVLPESAPVNQPLFMMPAGSRIKVTRTEPRTQQMVVEVNADTRELPLSYNTNDINKD